MTKPSRPMLMMTTLLVLCLALSACGPMVRPVADPGALPMASVGLQCVNTEPLKVEVLSMWPTGQGACFRQPGPVQELSALPATIGAAYAPVRVKLNVLAAGLREGDEVLAVIDHSAPKIRITAGPAAEYGTKLAPSIELGGSQEFTARWVSPRFKIGAPGSGASRDLMLQVECSIGPCRLGHVDWIRAPRF